MLIQFSFENYKCFKDKVTINLEAPKGTPRLYTNPSRKRNGVFKTSAVYGSNASGKTKLFEAFRFMKAVVTPPKRGGKIPVLDYWQTKYDPFRLNTYSKERKSSFETVILVDRNIYRYGFELNRTGFLTEWLYRTSNDSETLVFSRDGMSIEYNRDLLNQTIADSILSAGMVSPTVGFLSVLQTLNEPLAKKIVSWFDHAAVISANEIGESMPLDALSDNDKKKYVVDFLKSFDINIEDVSLHEMDLDDIPEKIKMIIGEDYLKGEVYDGIRTLHKQYNDLYEKEGEVWFSMEKDESYGTNRLVTLSWPILNALQNDSVIFIDEFDSGIHPIVAQTIVELFYMLKTKAQLIINTQNVLFLKSKTTENKKLFGKDQILLVSKNRYGESSVSSLTEYGNDIQRNLDSLYLEGDFGAIPYIVLDRLDELVKK